MLRCARDAPLSGAALQLPLQLPPQAPAPPQPKVGAAVSNEPHHGMGHGLGGSLPPPPSQPRPLLPLPISCRGALPPRWHAAAAERALPSEGVVVPAPLKLDVKLDVSAAPRRTHTGSPPVRRACPPCTLPHATAWAVCARHDDVPPTPQAELRESGRSMSSSPCSLDEEHHGGSEAWTAGDSLFSGPSPPAASGEGSRSASAASDALTVLMIDE